MNNKFRALALVAALLVILESPECSKQRGDAVKDQPNVKPGPGRDDWDERDRNAKTVCFETTGDPKRLLTVDWKLGKNAEKGARFQMNLGNWDRCELAESGDIANMLVENHDKPGTIVCTIWVATGKGKKGVIDFKITNGFHKCHVVGRVP